LREKHLVLEDEVVVEVNSEVGLALDVVFAADNAVNKNVDCETIGRKLG
jgi:hypothetical protein